MKSVLVSRLVLTVTRRYLHDVDSNDNCFENTERFSVYAQSNRPAIARAGLAINY